MCKLYESHVSGPTREVSGEHGHALADGLCSCLPRPQAGDLWPSAWPAAPHPGTTWPGAGTVLGQSRRPPAWPGRRGTDAGTRRTDKRSPLWSFLILSWASRWPCLFFSSLQAAACSFASRSFAARCRYLSFWPKEGTKTRREGALSSATACWESRGPRTSPAHPGDYSWAFPERKVTRAVRRQGDGSSLRP